MPSASAAASSTVARRWRLAGWIVLALGWALALGIYLTAPDSAPGYTNYSVVGGHTFADTGGPAGVQAQQIERVGGQGTLLLVRLDDWFGSLWQGRRLAMTLAVLTSIAALACRGVAGLVEDRDVT